MSTSSSNHQVFKTINPTTNEVLSEYQYDLSKSVESKIRVLSSSWNRWKNSTLEERQRFLKNLSQELRHQSDVISMKMALEMGKPLIEGKAEVEKSAGAAEYYSNHLEQILRSESVQIPGFHCSIQKESLGIVLAIMPWNYPLWQLIRFAVPAIAVGNVVLMKHSDLTAGTAELIEDMFFKANPSEKLLINTRMNHELAAQVIGHPDIRAITFTGSVRGGSQVAKQAGQHLKKTVMELGGSDPYIVLDDADLELTAKICARARMINNGQSCIAAKRFFIQEKVYDKFLERFSFYLSQYKIGDPVNLGVDVGPLASMKFKMDLQKNVNQLKSNGIEVDSSFDFKTSQGAYFQPLILKMQQNSKIWDEEFFGPVACVWSFQQDEEAIQLSNHSIFGLGGAVFCQNEGRALKVASKMESGMVFINEMVRSDVHLPFGGIKSSGYGRELGIYGPAEFMNIRTVARKI